MEPALYLALALALLFALTNGFLDAANAVAALVITRVASPAGAILLAAFFNMAGPLLLGGAVADTIGKIVTVPAGEGVAVIGAGLTGAIAWNLFAHRRRIPSSSSHALIGGLVGVALVSAGMNAVQWGGLDGLKPYGVLGVLLVLALAPLLGLAVGYLLELPLLWLGKRLSRSGGRTLAQGQWLASGWLSFAHGSNDAMKSVGIIAALFVVGGQATELTVSWPMILAAAAALTVGTALGGWGIVKTVGQDIYRIRQLDGLVVQSGSSLVILAASAIGAPVSTTQVVSSTIVGTGIGRGRRRHIDWMVVRAILITWVTTMPAAAALGVVSLPLWKFIT